MSQRRKVALDRPLRGLKLHPTHTPDPAMPIGDGEWLAGVRERMVRDEEVRQAVIAAARGIEQSLEQITPAVVDNLRDVTALATEIGLAIAREVVGAAIVDGLLDPSEVVLRCLCQSVRGGVEPDLRVELSPDDLNLVIASLEEHPEVRDVVGRVDFVANPGLSRACVEVSSQSGRMIYDPAEVLDRVCEAVRKEAQG